MDWSERIERAMAMDEATWQRHASPWSVWTRVPILPALAIAIYARSVLGWWCLIPVFLLIVWTFLNPRVFPPPARFDSWSARGVFGERLWLARKSVPIPSHHATVVRILNVAMAFGVTVLAYGLIVLDPWAAAAGVILSMGAKLWFVDRMVWLYDEVGDGRFTKL